MTKNKKIYINIDKGHIDMGYRIMYKKEGDMYAAYIPGFDIFYSAPSEEQLNRRSDALLKTFVDFWVDENSWKSFYLKLHKLGFKSPMHNLVMKKMLNNERSEAKFSVPNTLKAPKNFIGSKQLDVQMQVEV